MTTILNGILLRIRMSCFFDAILDSKFSWSFCRPTENGSVHLYVDRLLLNRNTDRDG